MICLSYRSCYLVYLSYLIISLSFLFLHRNSMVTFPSTLLQVVVSGAKLIRPLSQCIFIRLVSLYHIPSISRISFLTSLINLYTFLSLFFIVAHLDYRPIAVRRNEAVRSLYCTFIPVPSI